MTPLKLSEQGEIPQADFADLTRTAFKTPKETMRFKAGKNDEIEVYIVTSSPMDTFEQAEASAVPQIQWVSDPITFVASNSPRYSGPVTTSSQPITLSIQKTARLLLKEQQRPTALESGNSPKASAIFGVVFRDASPPLGPEEQPPSQKVYYYYREKYKLKFNSGILNLSFEDQSANQLNVATAITGPSENWFLMAGGPVYAYNFDTKNFGDNPTGLYVGLNWTPNDIFDPDPRYPHREYPGHQHQQPRVRHRIGGVGDGVPENKQFHPLIDLIGDRIHGLQPEFVQVSTFDHDQLRCDGCFAIVEIVIKLKKTCVAPFI